MLASSPSRGQERLLVRHFRERRVRYATSVRGAGLMHRDGIRNVVRVKRCARSPAAADASSHVYVVDLVVESEVVRR